jgi:hypothetical protein
MIAHFAEKTANGMSTGTGRPARSRDEASHTVAAQRDAATAQERCREILTGRPMLGGAWRLEPAARANGDPRSSRTLGLAGAEASSNSPPLPTMTSSGSVVAARETRARHQPLRQRRVEQLGRTEGSCWQCTPAGEEGSAGEPASHLSRCHDLAPLYQAPLLDRRPQ